MQNIHAEFAKGSEKRRHRRSKVSCKGKHGGSLQNLNKESDTTHHLQKSGSTSSMEVKSRKGGKKGRTKSLGDNQDNEIIGEQTMPDVETNCEESEPTEIEMVQICRNGSYSGGSSGEDEDAMDSLPDDESSPKSQLVNRIKGTAVDAPLFPVKNVS